MNPLISLTSILAPIETGCQRAPDLKRQEKASFRAVTLWAKGKKYETLHDTRISQEQLSPTGGGSNSRH
jgi:hypothetical protein